MKGLTHGVWYSDSLFDFSDIDERTAEERLVLEIKL